MPILLTTPLTYEQGHGIASAVYNELRISCFAIDLDAQSVTMRCTYGNTVDGVWIRGAVAPATHVFENIPAVTNGETEIEPAKPNYDDLILTPLTTVVGLSLYTEVKQALYQKLIDNGVYQGVIQ